MRKLFKIKNVKKDEDISTETEPSNVGNQLSELTTRRVILLVLTMLVMLPTFDGGLDEQINDVQDYGLVQLNKYQVSLNVNITLMENMVKMYKVERIKVFQILMML